MSRFALVVLSVLAITGIANADAAPGHWDYENPDRDWPAITPECAGQRQSPIRIEDDKTVKTTAFLRQYQSRLASFELTAKNNGHSVEIDLAPRQMFLTSSLFPDLMQAVGVHWHAPSEHRIGDKQFVAEMHVVYQPIDRTFWADGRPPIVVMGYLIDEIDGSTVPPAQQAEWEKEHNDPLLTELLAQKTDLQAINKEIKVKFVPRLPFFTEFYTYEGSLTTPNCFETVAWHLATTPMKVPKKQLDEFLPLLRSEHGGSGDARPVQPLNGRTVHKVTTHAAQPVASNVVSGSPNGSPAPAPACDGTQMNFFFGSQTGVQTADAPRLTH